MSAYRLVLAVCVAMSLVACGGGGSSNSAGGGATEKPEPEPVETTEEEEVSACLGKKKGPVVKVLAGRTGGSATGFDAVRFHPDKLRLPAGKLVTIKVVHGAGPGHTFTIDALDCDTGILAAGDVAFVSFKVPAGTTEFHCVPHGSGGMDGKIIGVKR